MSSQLQWPICEEIDAFLGDQVILLQADADAKFVVVEAGLHGKEVAFGKRIVPAGIEMRPLMRRQADAVAEMMVEDPWVVFG